jgi:hypothetical protein
MDCCALHMSAFTEGNMRWIRPALLFVLVGGISLHAQTVTPPPPQSARQALLEMLFGKGENDFQKHLPEDARQTLIRKGETPDTSTILRISTIGRQMMAQGEHVETFDTGSIFLTGMMNEHEKVEFDVERDNLMGEADEIELSVHYYKDAQPQTLPIVPDLIFTLKQEKEIWRLTEITAAAHIPLTDPDYLKGLRKQQDEEIESQARNRIMAIASGEASYVGKHPDLGYSCSLPTLSPNPGESGVVFDPGQGGDEWYGYRFTLSACEGTPPSKYRIIAVPMDSDAGLKTFCSDESGSVKFLAGGKTSNCFTRGKPISDDNRGSD